MSFVCVKLFTFLNFLVDKNSTAESGLQVLLIKNQGKFTVIVNKSTLVSKEVSIVKEFNLLLKVHDRFVNVTQRWNPREPSRKVFNIDR